jgi:PAS domain S-box-containing protein
VNLEVTSSKTVWHGETADLVIFRDIDHRKETEKKHKKIKDGLEDLVQKRTVELSQAVERLEEEISNHKETAMRLREAENKFRTLVEQPPNAIIYIASLDETSSTLYISPQIEPILGYTQEEFKADPDLWAKSIHPDDYDRVIAEVATCHETGEQFVSEYRMIRKDGSLIWFNDHARIVQLGDGDRSYLLGINTDITQQKQMENALRKREEELTQKSEHLEEVNVALRILLRQIEKEKEEIKENILVNLKQLVFPNIEKLKGSRLDNSQAAIVSILETDLKDITSPLVTRLSSVYLKFTTTEIKVANLIKDGRNTKEIAELLNLSPNTVMFHRYNLRRKLGLKGHNINLRSYLRSFKD